MPPNIVQPEGVALLMTTSYRIDNTARMCRVVPALPTTGLNVPVRMVAQLRLAPASYDQAPRGLPAFAKAEGNWLETREWLERGFEWYELSTFD
jgi:hypothetical protein